MKSSFKAHVAIVFLSASKCVCENSFYSLTKTQIWLQILNVCVCRNIAGGAMKGFIQHLRIKNTNIASDHLCALIYL